MSNETLTEAKRAKKDEFYTQFGDIQNEISAYLEYNPKLFKNKTVILPCDDPEKSNFTKFFSQNFQRFGLKKLISTSYAPNSKLNKYGFQGDLFDSKQSKGKEKSDTKGKIFQLSKDINADGKINIDDIEWDFLKGDGDFNDSEIIEMIKDGTITEGMIPKINACLDAINNGVTAVGIINGTKKHSCLWEIFSDKGSGTLIRK